MRTLTISLLVVVGLCLAVTTACADGHSRHPHVRHGGQGNPFWGPSFGFQPSGPPSIRTALPMGPIYEDRFGRLCQDVFWGALARSPFQTMCQDRFGRWVSTGR